MSGSVWKHLVEHVHVCIDFALDSHRSTIKSAEMIQKRDRKGRNMLQGISVLLDLLIAMISVLLMIEVIQTLGELESLSIPKFPRL